MPIYLACQLRSEGNYKTGQINTSINPWAPPSSWFRSLPGNLKMCPLLHTSPRWLFQTLLSYCIVLYCIPYSIISHKKTRSGVTVLGRVISIYLLTKFFTDTLWMFSMAGRTVSWISSAHVNCHQTTDRLSICVSITVKSHTKNT